MQIDGEEFETFRGVPQGAILSPFIFCIAVDHILTSKVMHCKHLGYSDDLSVVIEGRLPL